MAAGVAVFLAASSFAPGAAPQPAISTVSANAANHSPSHHWSSFIAADGCRTGDASPCSAPSSKSALNVTAPATAVATLTERDAYSTAQRRRSVSADAPVVGPDVGGGEQVAGAGRVDGLDGDARHAHGALGAGGERARRAPSVTIASGARSRQRRRRGLGVARARSAAAPRAR